MPYKMSAKVDLLITLHIIVIHFFLNLVIGVGNFLSLFIKLLHLLMICHVMENKQNSICIVVCRVTFVLNLGESFRVKNCEFETILRLILPNFNNTIRIVDAYANIICHSLTMIAAWAFVCAITPLAYIGLKGIMRI